MIATTLLLNTAESWPVWQHLLSLLLLRDYNTRIVLLGATLLGLAAGIMGAFMLLRKRALIGDAISHATLPGITLAFLIMTSLGGSGKALPGLLFGALLSGCIGMGCVQLIRSQTTLKEDSALGIVLSVFFGLGIALLGIIQKMKLGHAAGLQSFIYGKTASMLISDVKLMALASFSISLICALLFKELRLVCFDANFAQAQGWPVHTLDLSLMGLVVAVTVIGLQAVGLILIIALLIIPAAAARFWTEELRTMVMLSGLLGALSALIGSAISSLAVRLPTGAIIVIVAAIIFLISMLLGKRRGLLLRLREHYTLIRRIKRQHLLRAMYEYCETHHPAALTAVGCSMVIPSQYLLKVRSWSAAEMGKAMRICQDKELIIVFGSGDCHFTDRGFKEAKRTVRNHRLWELYLIKYADIAPNHVDRDADQIEHLLSASMVEQLEQLLPEYYPLAHSIPSSPHHIIRDDRDLGSSKK